MDQQQLAEQIATAVIKDTQFWTALLGLLGVLIGSVITIAGNFFLHLYQTRRVSSVDEARKDLLKQMLNDSRFQEGRSIDTLSKVTGCGREECCRLLIEIGARGFTLDDGREGWTYIVKRPLNQQ